MNQLRTVVEAWPALLTEEMAARYLSLEVAAFRRTASQLHLGSVEIDGASRWRKADLDHAIKRLATKPAPPISHGGSRSDRLTQGDIDLIAAAVARQLEHHVAPQRAVVSVKEACTLLGIGRSTLYHWINDGLLEPRRIGRRTLIPLTQLQGIIDGRS